MGLQLVQLVESEWGPLARLLRLILADPEVPRFLTDLLVPEGPLDPPALTGHRGRHRLYRQRLPLV